MASALALHTQTFPRCKPILTITFLATEEHGSRASPELKSDWRRKLQPHHDLQGEEGGGGRGEDWVTQACYLAGGWPPTETLR